MMASQKVRERVEPAAGVRAGPARTVLVRTEEVRLVLVKVAEAEVPVPAGRTEEVPVEVEEQQTQATALVAAEERG